MMMPPSKLRVSGLFLFRGDPYDKDYRVDTGFI